MSVPPLIRPRAVLFDMDGTLTQPMLDFPRIKAEMGIGSGPILESMAKLEEQARKKAETVLLQHEEIAAEESHLNAGCLDLLKWLSDARIPVAVVTRNSRLSADTVMRRHGLELSVRITREDGPFKPSPFPLELACRRLGVAGEQTWMVGDGQYDVEAAIAAGMRSVWISYGKSRSFIAEPWLTARDLIELLDIMKRAENS